MTATKLELQVVLDISFYSKEINAKLLVISSMDLVILQRLQKMNVIWIVLPISQWNVEMLTLVVSMKSKDPNTLKMWDNAAEKLWMIISYSQMMLDAPTTKIWGTWCLLKNVQASAKQTLVVHMDWDTSPLVLLSVIVVQVMMQPQIHRVYQSIQCIKFNWKGITRTRFATKCHLTIIQ